MQHRSWVVPHRRRSMDKKGIAVALAFLVAISLLVGGNKEKEDFAMRWQQQQLVVSSNVDIRQVAQARGKHSILPVESPIQIPRRGERLGP